MSLTTITLTMPLWHSLEALTVLTIISASILSFRLGARTSRLMRPH